MRESKMTLTKRCADCIHFTIDSEVDNMDKCAWHKIQIINPEIFPVWFDMEELKRCLDHCINKDGKNNPFIKKTQTYFNCGAWELKDNDKEIIDEKS